MSTYNTEHYKYIIIIKQNNNEEVYILFRNIGLLWYKSYITTRKNLHITYTK